MSEATADKAMNKHCLMCGLRDRELLLARVDDESAYRCLGCGELKNSYAVRLGWGWVCSEKCMGFVQEQLEEDKGLDPGRERRTGQL